MRWLKLWLFLSSSYLLGRLATAWMITGRWGLRRQLWVEVAAVSVVQLALLAPLLLSALARRRDTAAPDTTGRISP